MRLNKWGSVLVALVFALGLQSCEKYNQEEDSRYPILFSNNSTRAVAGENEVKQNGFRVYAHLRNIESQTVAGNFDRKVTFENSTWGYTGVLYWLPGMEYDFTAIYPADPFKNGDYTFEVTSEGFSITDYKVSSQTDLMVGNVTRQVPLGQNAPNEGSTVNITLNHILSCVEIKAKTDLDNITVHSLTLENIKDHGNYSSGVWNSNNTGSAECISNTQLVKNAGFTDITKGGFVVIPGEYNTVKLRLEASNKTYILDIPEINWIKGKKYTYTVEIKQNYIIFNDSPKVDQWDSESATGSVIIK